MVVTIGHGSNRPRVQLADATRRFEHADQEWLSSDPKADNFESSNIHPIVLLSAERLRRAHPHMRGAVHGTLLLKRGGRLCASLHRRALTGYRCASCHSNAAAACSSSQTRCNDAPLKLQCAAARPGSFHSKPGCRVQQKQLLSEAYQLPPTRQRRFSALQMQLAAAATAAKDGAAGAPAVSQAEDTVVQYVVLRRDLWSDMGWPLGSIIAQACGLSEHISGSPAWI